MNYILLFFLQVVGPLIILGLYALIVPKIIEGLVAGVKSKNKVNVWAYSWSFLAFLYFFILMVKRGG